MHRAELRPLVGLHGSDSAEVAELARVWRKARAGCLAFLNELPGRSHALDAVTMSSAFQHRSPDESTRAIEKSLRRP